MLRIPSIAGVKGFTLIELMVGLVIMAIVLALAMPNYMTWMQNTRIRNTAESILNGLQVARMEAVRQNAPVKLVLGAGSAWTVGCVTVTAACPATIQSHSTGEGSSTAITVTSNGGVTVTFDQFGRRTTPAAGTTTLDVTATGSRALRVTIDVGGNTRMCDPDSGIATSDPRHC
jgi:type IV fimbrial biogenesis protein FimT